MQASPTTRCAIDMTTTTIFLRDVMDTDSSLRPSVSGWGHYQGSLTATRMRRMIEEQENHDTTIILSLAGVKRMDVSYLMELLLLIRQWRFRHNVCLVNLADRDLRLNWDATAKCLRQPLFSWDDDTQNFYMLGYYPRLGLRNILQFVLATARWTSATDVAEALDLPIGAAAGKLKQLWFDGYIQCLQQLPSQERAASNGNTEDDAFVYRRIAPPVGDSTSQYNMQRPISC